MGKDVMINLCTKPDWVHCAHWTSHNYHCPPHVDLLLIITADLVWFKESGTLFTCTRSEQTVRGQPKMYQGGPGQSSRCTRSESGGPGHSSRCTRSESGGPGQSLRCTRSESGGPGHSSRCTRSEQTVQGTAQDVPGWSRATLKMYQVWVR